MMRWLLTMFGSFVWGTVVLYAGLAMFFPSEQVTNYVKYEVQESTNKKYLVDVDNLGFGVLGSLQVDNLTLYESKPGRRERGQKDIPPRQNTQWFSIPTLTLRPQIFSLLRGRLMADVGMETPGGNLDMSVGGDLSHFFLDIDTDGLDLSFIPFELEESIIQLAGSLQIESELEFNLDEIKESSGELELSIDDLTLVSGTVSGFSLPETAFSESILNMEIEDGRLNVKKGSFISDVLEVTVEGYINLRKNLLRSNANLKVQVQFDDSYDKLAKIALKSSRDDEGVYHFRGSGRINNLRFRPDRSKSRQRERASPENTFEDDRANTADRPARKSSALSDDEREERRQKRRDRLQKRRERMRKRRDERRTSAVKDPRPAATRQDDFDPLEAQYDEENVENLPPEDIPQQRYEDENEANQDQDYQEYDDPNEVNENLEDMGYIDED